MVSDRKIKFFTQRVNDIAQEKRNEINKKFVNVSSDYQSLIRQGKGKLLSEKEIREVVADKSHWTCPITIELTTLFTFKNERKAAEEENNRISAKRNAKLDAVDAKLKQIMDLVYFGTDEQMLAAIKEMEAM